MLKSLAVSVISTVGMFGLYVSAMGRTTSNLRASELFVIFTFPVVYVSQMYVAYVEALSYRYNNAQSMRSDANYLAVSILVLTAVMVGCEMIHESAPANRFLVE